MTTQEMQDTLEALIDSNTLASVVNALARICEEKAEHIRSNWQDGAMAKGWDHDARMLARPNIYN